MVLEKEVPDCLPARRSPEELRLQIGLWDPRTEGFCFFGKAKEMNWLL